MAFGSQKYLFKKDNYEVRRNTTDAQLDALWGAIGLGGGSGITISASVTAFADLPAAGDHAGEYYIVQTTTGIIGFRKYAGLWRSDGFVWVYLGNPVAAASDIANVPAGTISSTDVQGAVNELDSDLTSHVGSRGASHATSTTTEAGFISALDHLKLSGIQANATANSTDSFLLSRANHTGTQATSTITNFNTEVDSRASTLISAHTGAADPHPGYLTPAEGNAAYSLLGHSHVISDVTGLQTALDGKLGTGSEAASVNTINGRISAGTNISLTGSGTAASPYVIGSNVTSIVGITGTLAQFNTAITDADILSVASAASTYQPLDAQLTDLAGLSYAANALKVIRVNAGETGFELATAGGGGGGSPGGATGEVQYNDGASGFAGAANVEIEGGNLRLVSTTDPTAPTGGILLYSKSIAGKHLPKMIGPSGIDTLLETGWSYNSKFIVRPQTGTTAPTCVGGTLTTAATMSVQQTIASANPWQATWRKRFATTTTAGNATGMRTAYAPWFRGSAAGFGGFFFRIQFGQNINLNGAQCFYGLCASTGVLASTAGAVSALVNMIGVGYDTTDSSAGNWQLFRNDGTGTATKVDLGANAGRNTTHGYDLIIHCPPGVVSSIFVRIVNIHTGVVVLDTSYNTDIPAADVGLAFKAEGNNGAVAAAMNLEVSVVSIESDY